MPRSRQEILLQQYGLRGIEETRRARDDLFSVQNSRKALLGMLAGLQDPQVLSDKAAAEKSLPTLWKMSRYTLEASFEPFL